MGAVTTYAAQAWAGIRVSLADRTNFVLQCAGMILNNGFILVLWFMFFQGFKTIGGWRMPDMALLIGLLATVVGAAGAAFGGYRDMAAAILRGEPDAYLTQPKAVLWRMLARESIVIGWGDLITGLVLLAVFAQVRPGQIGWLVLVLACGTTVYLSMAVTFASLAFWVRGARSFARDLTDFMIMFANYPGSIYSGTAKLVIYTVFPAGFMVLIPVALLRHPSLERALILAAAAAGYTALALTVFHLGLRRYRQGGTAVTAG